MNSIMKIAIPRGIGEPACDPCPDEGVGNQRGNGPTRFVYSPPIANTTNTDVIPFQNMQMNARPAAPAIDRAEALTMIRDPSSSIRHPRGG
ncbi:MAG TPA: hypothetical protein VHC70_14440, partial [Phycisphaerales bacterium]|nr:hypothetical protein [Phycisphaerales bacterium]